MKFNVSSPEFIPLALLLFLVSGLLFLPFVTSQMCHQVPHSNGPRIKIQSSPSFNRFPFGVLLNLTCIASQNNELKPKQQAALSRPISIQWFDSRNHPVRNGTCNAGLSEAEVMTCTLMVGPLTLNEFGNYTCRARAEYSCSIKSIAIRIHESETPKITRHPVSRSAATRSTVTFNCTASGYPKPTIRWMKNNDSYSVQYNPRAKVMTDEGKSFSQLVITGVTREDYGKYQCIANNSAGVRISRGAFLYRGTVDLIKGPQIVIAPVNHSAVIGSNVTFTCTATGFPKPIITWKKANNSLFTQSNAGVRITTDDDDSLRHSKLVITAVRREDYGKYQCVANNSAGKNISQVVFLFPGDQAPKPYRSLKPPEATRSNHKIIVAVVVPSVVSVVLVVCGLSCFLWYRRSRRTRVTSASITCTDSVERVSLPSMPTLPDPNNMPLQEETKNAYDFTDSPLSPTSIQRSEEIHLPDVEVSSEDNPLLGDLRVDIPTLKLLQAGQPSSITGVEVIPPKRPPKPRRKENTEQQFVCSFTLQSWNSGPRLQKSDTLTSKDSGYDSAEETIYIDSDFASDTVKKNVYSLQNILEDNEEGWEVDSKSLEVFRDKVLGQGEFGIVYKGHYHKKDGNVVDVAVKQLKDRTNVTNRNEFLSEIQILKQAGPHPNIVNLVGACTQEERILVVTELMPRGSLENLLKSKGEREKYKNVNCELNDWELLEIALQVASGMQHLQERKFIHRDLAARNIFIDDNNVAKVGDFGLARDISNDGIYTKTSNGKVPWRWSSLESLRDRVYTTQSDVWSFGIVLWEITTYGEEPYHDLSTPAALIGFLLSGKRMSRPEHCSEKLYKLMSSCWEENPLMRPMFSGITKQLQKYLSKEYKRPYVNTMDDEICIDLEDL